MAADVGRNIVLTWNSAEVPGVRQKGIALSGAAVDVTSDESDGWRTLLSVAGQNEVTISLSGVTKSDALIKDWFAGTRTRDVVITYPDGGVIEGEFFLSSYTDTGPYNDAATFDAELMSTGAVTFTPA